MARIIATDLTGVREALKATSGIRQEVVAQLKKALVSIGNDVQRTMVDSIRSGNKKGRVYQRGERYHIASAPGEAPATDTGRLVGAIGVFPNLDALEVEIGIKRPMVDYAASLEFGTRTVAPRPFVLPAGEKNRENAFKKFQLAVERGRADGEKRR